MWAFNEEIAPTAFNHFFMKIIKELVLFANIYLHQFRHLLREFRFVRSHESNEGLTLQWFHHAVLVLFLLLPALTTAAPDAPSY